MKHSTRKNKNIKKYFLLNTMLLLGSIISTQATAETFPITINSGETLSLDSEEGKDLTGQDSITNNGTLSISNSSFSNNIGSYNGVLSNLGIAEITNTTFSGNSGNYYSGAVTSRGTSNSYITISDSTFTNNVFTDWGASGAVYIGNTTSQSSITNSLFENNEAMYEDPNNPNRIGGGGAVGLGSGELGISNSSFNNNQAVSGGAIYLFVSRGTRGNLTLQNSDFDSNSALGAGGAIGNFSIMSVDNTYFTNNESTGTGSGGGALFLGSSSNTSINNSFFGQKADSTIAGNTSGSFGGAIGTRENIAGSHETATLDINNTIFTNNSAITNGGAIFNTLYNNANDEGFVSISNSTFTNNSAGNGGAIYNDGTGDFANNYAKMTITDSVFANNTATTNGGAIYNAGTNGVVNLAGTNTFSGNTANNLLNDIYNEGNLNVAGSLILEGGISGNGTTTFANGSNLNIKAGTTTITNNVINNGATLAMSFDNDFDTSTNYTLITGNLDNEFTINDNALYNISSIANGTYAISKKSTDDIANSLGATDDQVHVISAIAGTITGHNGFDEIAHQITDLLQSGDSEQIHTALETITTIAPDTTPALKANTKTQSNQIFSVVSSRLSGGIAEGRSGGDMFKNSAIWIQGLYNKSKYDKGIGFDSNTKGFVAGAEKQLLKSTKMGVGYSFTKTDMDSGSRGADIRTNTAFAYGEYKPTNWFMNAIATYAWNKNKEESPIKKGKYDMNSFATQVMTGYHIPTGEKTFITPEIGLRYVNINQKDYYDSIGQHISNEKSDLLTGVIETKINHMFLLQNATIIPELKIGATYDMITDKSTSIVTLPGGMSYTTGGEILKKFGVEVSAGIVAKITDSTEFYLGYDGRFKQDFINHSGILNMKYHF